jgi:hypothetical protein
MKQQITVRRIEGRFGRLSAMEHPFSANSDGFLIGTYYTLEESLESLERNALIHPNDKGPQ